VKKVCYAIGAVGIAPTLGLVTPAATAAATVTHNPGGTGKTVSFRQDRDGVRPMLNCGRTHHAYVVSPKADISGSIYWSGTNCVNQVGAFLYKRQTGLTMRVRFYSGDGALEYTAWDDNGTIGFTSTSWDSTANVYAHKVCEALVANGNHNDVEYGGSCETT